MFDAEVDKEAYESNLNVTDGYWNLQGSEKTDRWNPNGCNSMYFENYTRTEWYDVENNM